jgi:hypothetical protein
MIPSGVATEPPGITGEAAAMRGVLTAAVPFFALRMGMLRLVPRMLILSGVELIGLLECSTEPSSEPPSFPATAPSGPPRAKGAATFATLPTTCATDFTAFPMKEKKPTPLPSVLVRELGPQQRSGHR